MDIETVEWIASQQPVELGSLDISLDPEDMEFLRRHLPQPAVFLNPDNYGTIHGILHIGRVMANSFVLCKQLGIDYRPHVIAASLHDIRRINDRRDAGHGQRAAEWFAGQSGRMLSELDAPMAAAVYHGIYYHDVDMQDIPQKILHQHSQAIQVLKAADALDRYRQPNLDWWPDKKYIDLSIDPRMPQFCKSMVVVSERLSLSGTDPNTTVWDALIQLSAA